MLLSGDDIFYIQETYLISSQIGKGARAEPWIYLHCFPSVIRDSKCKAHINFSGGWAALCGPSYTLLLKYKLALAQYAQWINKKERKDSLKLLC